MKSFSTYKRSVSWLGIGAIIAVLIITAILFLSLGCSSYNPALYPSYDVLNPGEKVRLNPLAFTEDGNLIVNKEFIAWVDELKQEIIRLRKELK